MIFEKGRGAEDMIGMAMRVNDIKNRLVVRPGANGGAQFLPCGQVSARVDDSDAIAADDEAAIADLFRILLVGQGNDAGKDVTARRDFHSNGRRCFSRPGVSPGTSDKPGENNSCETDREEISFHASRGDCNGSAEPTGRRSRFVRREMTCPH
jgi:hypothetical protein